MFAALIIDADADARSVIENSLGPYGLEFTTSHEPAEAMSLARTATPDIIFLRVELPGASGFSVCNKLRRNEDTKYIPLIMYASDVADDVFAQHGKLKTRADEYMRLPVSGESLLDTVRTLLPLPGQPIAPAGGNGQSAPAAVVPDDDIIEDVDLDAGIDYVEAEDDPASEPVVDLGVETDAAFDALTFADDDDEEEFEVAPEEVIQPAEPDPEILDEVALDLDADAPADEVEALEAGEAGGPPPPPAAESVPDHVADEVSVELEPADEPAAREHENSGGNLSARREVLRLKSELNKKDRELLTLRDELEAKDRAILDAKHRNRQLQTQASEAEGRALQLEEQVISAQEQAEVANRNAESSRKREEGLKTRIEASQKKTKELEAKLDEVDKAHAELSDKASGLEAEFDSLMVSAREFKEERDTLATELAEQKNTSADLGEKLQEAEAGIAERDEKITELETTLASQAEESQSELDFLERRADQMRQQMQEAAKVAAADKAALEETVAEHQSNITRLEGELGMLQSESQQLEERLSQRVAELEQQLAAHTDAARRAQQALAVALKVLE